ncbi:mechanosensitive ion channel family protein [Rubrivivax gelatinosus]|uniref:Small conductance mechanosensitive channel n=1 Tax=Rubrivivax gelatinosus TaxID=28068 RepID=A0A4R2LUA2_RUBGE|nr:mechanosensitive ion channel family protein [Rubrivivax gelatinosus]MBK1690265.1 mechanosensitive ion channel protein MscS [Rubrivivax gelatinosus]TCO97651.1 small conductance mechanosensitive channel [Rubrivivax gelatinosus]
MDLSWTTALTDPDFGRWSEPLRSGLRIVLIVIAAWVLAKVLQRLVRAMNVRFSQRLEGDAVRRAETINRVARYLIGIVVGALAVMTVLAEVGISLAPVLGAAGVVGIAVGFGAQSLVKDYFTGFFILFEDQIRTGDVVEVAGIGGLVEDITLRHVRLRDYDGNVHYVPNSLITTVTNRGRQFAFSVVDLRIAYRENLDEVYAVVREVAEDLRADERFAPRILQEIEIAGVERWDESAVTVRARFKVAPLAQWDVRREFLRRLKRAFDERGIEIPYPHLTVYAGADKDGRAPALPLGIRRQRVPDAANA